MSVFFISTLFLRCILYSLLSLYPHNFFFVLQVLTDASLRAEWLVEVKAMADRIQSMRDQLVVNLAACGSMRDWSHIKKQIGMFCFTGLTKAQVMYDTVKN